MSQLRSRLLEEISKVSAVDSHTFVDPLRPTARGLEDILSHPPFAELLQAVGYGAALGHLEPSPAERSIELQTALARIENTLAHGWLLELSRGLFGQGDPDLCEADACSSIPGLWRRSAERLSSSGWDANLRYQMGVERLLVECAFDHPLEGFDPKVYVPSLRADELVFGLQDPGVIERLREVTRSDVGNAQCLRAAQGETANRFARRGARAICLSPPADFSPAAAPASPPEALVRRGLSGAALTLRETQELQNFAFWCLLERCLEERLVVQLCLGESRPRITRGLVCEGRLPVRSPGPGAYRAAFLAFPEVTFSVSAPGDDREVEIAAYASRLPNVVTPGRWTLSGGQALAADLRTRLDTVPKTKLIGYPTDAFCLESMLPRLRHQRRVLSEVLAADFVEGRGWSEECAVRLATEILRANAERVYFPEARTE